MAYITAKILSCAPRTPLILRVNVRKQRRPVGASRQCQSMQNKAYIYVKSKKKLDNTWEISTNKYGDRKISTFLRNKHIHYL